MMDYGFPGEHGLEQQGLSNLARIYWNLTPAALIEQIVNRKEAVISSSGAVVVNTGRHTGRSPADKYIVDHRKPYDRDIWWGKVNQPLSSNAFNLLLSKARAYLQGRDVFVQDLRVCSHPDYQMPVRLISEKAWAALFARNLLIELPVTDREHLQPQLTVIHLPDFHATVQEDHTHSTTAVILDLHQQCVLICGTAYAGEIKKALFTMMNYLLPSKGVLPMHCSANVGENGDVSLFFGLSGTGKTTLSSDPERQLVGDDEHAWFDSGVFNIEGGCYAKVIHLRPELEPLIWKAANRFGTVLENVTCNPRSRALDFDDDHRTENTRAAYPLAFIPNIYPHPSAGLPANVFFLTADAFGVLPPVARLDPDQLLFYFLSGYTSKLAGTEAGLGTEPQATFSTCFGAPFLPLPPARYATLLEEKCQQNRVKVWLVNTGWTGGPYGTGSRMSLRHTREIIRRIHSGELETVPYVREPFFNLNIPCSCPGLPSSILDPRQTWSDPEAYSLQAKNLKLKFEKNFEQFLGTNPSP